MSLHGFKSVYKPRNINVNVDQRTWQCSDDTNDDRLWNGSEEDGNVRS